MTTYNKTLSISDSGIVTIGNTIADTARLNVSKHTSHSILVGRAGGQPNILSKTGALILDSGTSHSYLNYYSNKTITLAYGGGNVSIGTVAAANVTSSSDLTISGTIYNEDWIVAVLSSPWIRYSESWEEPAFWKNKHGIVQMRGMVRNGSTATTMFTLPTGYRPQDRELQTAMGHNGSNYIHVRVDILPNGTVQPIWSGSTNWITLTRINFRAYQ